MASRGYISLLTASSASFDFRRDGDDYIINGSKIFITSGVHADFYTVAVGHGRHVLRTAPRKGVLVPSLTVCTLLFLMHTWCQGPRGAVASAC